MLEPTELRAFDARPTELDFEGFFSVEYPQLARAYYLLTGEAAEAEDLAQEAMARTFERWDRVGAMDSPAGYVYRIAFNLNQKRLRRLAVRARKLIGALQSPDPTEAVDTRNEVLLALQSVPAAQREALVLVGWFGMDASIAAATHFTTSHKRMPPASDVLAAPDPAIFGRVRPALVWVERPGPVSAAPTSGLRLVMPEYLPPRWWAGIVTLTRRALTQSSYSKCPDVVDHERYDPPRPPVRRAARAPGARSGRSACGPNGG
jgi:DNA-directed RNA polymerase specialized sigma24 family protein